MQGEILQSHNLLVKVHVSNIRSFTEIANRGCTSRESNECQKRKGQDLINLVMKIVNFFCQKKNNNTKNNSCDDFLT